MTKPQYIVITTSPDSMDDVEAFGPFTSPALAQKTAAEYEEYGCRPAYPVEVIELFPVRGMLSQIRDAKREADEEDS